MLKKKKDSFVTPQIEISVSELICFTLLELMAYSYTTLYEGCGYITKKCGTRIPKITKEKHIIDLFEQFSKYNLKSTTWDIGFKYRDGIEQKNKFSEAELLRIIRNQLAHTVRNLGSAYSSYFEDHESDNNLFFKTQRFGQLDKENQIFSIILNPFCLCGLTYEIAEGFKEYCLEKDLDPRTYLEPESMSLV